MYTGNYVTIILNIPFQQKIQIQVRKSLSGNIFVIS